MPIQITTWNVQNFATADDDFPQKLPFLCQLLQQLDSDVIALQEVLDVDALEHLANELRFQFFAAEPDRRGNRVAFLARPGLGESTEQIDRWQLPESTAVRRFDSNGNIVVEPTFPRPALKITVGQNGRKVDVINAHLKSKLLTFGGRFSTRDETLRAQTALFALERRAAEATSLRWHVTNLLEEDRAVVVVGDLNDGPEAATTQILYGASGSQPRGPGDAQDEECAFQRQDADDRQRLFNVAKLVPENSRWSRRHNGQAELLDHILGSDALMPRVNGLRQVPTVCIVNGNTPTSHSSNPTRRELVPDHAPVTATFL